MRYPLAVQIEPIQLLAQPCGANEKVVGAQLQLVTRPSSTGGEIFSVNLMAVSNIVSWEPIVVVVLDFSTVTCSII